MLKIKVIGGFDDKMIENQQPIANSQSLTRYSGIDNFSN
jgi:hypothetical protein